VEQFDLSNPILILGMGSIKYSTSGGLTTEEPFSSASGLEVEMFGDIGKG